MASYIKVKMVKGVTSQAQGSLRTRTYIVQILKFGYVKQALMTGYTISKYMENLITILCVGLANSGRNIFTNFQKTGEKNHEGRIRPISLIKKKKESSAEHQKV